MEKPRFHACTVFYSVEGRREPGLLVLFMQARQGDVLCSLKNKGEKLIHLDRVLHMVGHSWAWSGIT